MSYMLLQNIEDDILKMHFCNSNTAEQDSEPKRYNSLNSTYDENETILMESETSNIQHNTTKLSFNCKEFYPKSVSKINYAFPFSHTSNGPFFSLDVECVANGYCHTDRVPALVAIVNYKSEVIYKSYIKPNCKIISYLTELTGITEEMMENAPSLEEVRENIKIILPSNSILIGQGIIQDILWLGLERGVDYNQAIDIKKYFSISTKEIMEYYPQYHNTYPYIYFSLRHEVYYIFGIDMQNGTHDPILDAFYSMELFKRYRHNSIDEMKEIRLYLSSCPRLMSYSYIKPTIELVSMKCDSTCNKKCNNFHTIDEVL